VRAGARARIFAAWLRAVRAAHSQWAASARKFRRVPIKGHARYVFARDHLQHCATLALRPSAAACRRHPAMEHRNGSTSARRPPSFTLAVSRCEGEGHVISTLCRNPLQTRIAVDSFE